MLWEATAPNKSVQIEYSKMTEDELKSKGIKYITDEKTKSIYIEKDSTSKSLDYTYRVLGTPITVALDAGSIAFILISYMIGQNEVDKAMERGKEAEATKNGYRTEPSLPPR